MRTTVFLIGLLLSSMSFAGEITWSVENGFPQFRKSQHFKELKLAWPPGESAKDFLAHQTAHDLRRLLPETRDTLWMPDTGNYDETAFFRKDHAILVEYKGAPEKASCTWFLGEKQIGPAYSCGLVKLIPDVPEGEDFTLRVKVTDDPGLTITDRIKPHFILGFGDSFSSGEGNPDHAAIGTSKITDRLVKGFDILSKGEMSDKHFADGAKWWDATCHRSLLAWQSMYALQRAVTNEHEVVRFASYTCSGAEVYDGFFRAQLNPPVVNESDRVKNYRDRDGGNYLNSIGTPREEKPNAIPALNKSQLNAAIDLLCPGRVTRNAGKFNGGNEIKALKERTYYGAVKYDICSDNLRPVDEVMISFGGNDFGFSGVVKWGLIPREVYESELADSKNSVVKAIGISDKIMRKNMLASLRALSRVIKPSDADKVANRHMTRIYEDLGEAISKQLNIEPGKVYAMLYPNPLQTPFQNNCSERMNMGNVAMTELIVKGAKHVPSIKRKAPGFQFLITESHAEQIEREYINNLIEYQRKAISANKWNAVDSQSSFSGRSLCAVSPPCQDGVSCPDGELFAWTGKSDTEHASLRPITSFARWDAYSSERTRSIRTSNDAFMTMARFNKEGKLEDDWIMGAVHPDAVAHATIADQVMSIVKK